MFKPVDNRQSFPKMEEEVLRFWKDNDIFRKSVESRPEDKTYVFYEGPPTANARPGVHHVLARVFKDLFPRYKTMRGYRVPRKGGWDTHGLPVELEVERELGLKSKPEIENFGIEEFNRRCRESVFRYVQEWEALTERIAFWVDLEGAYRTYDNDYIESVWTIIKQLWDGGLVYQDYRSTPHCPRCGTSLSDAEVALGYREDTPDPSVYVKFRLADDAIGQWAGLKSAPTYLLAWTTTPWTLPGNTALAVQPQAQYAVVETDGERIILASGLASDVLGSDHEVLGCVLGKTLVGLHYHPLYAPTDWGAPAMWFDQAQDGRLVPVEGADVPNAYVVLGGDFVSLEDGTGVVHVAPAFGGEDFDLGKQNGLLFLQPVDLRGNMPAGSPWPEAFVKDADNAIMDDLTARGLLLKREVIKHTYPFCWRCGTPLLYYAKPTWYIRTTAVKDSLIAGNDRINWYPDHIKNGRFGDWLRNNVDWAISRERYWGTPLPVWKCTSCDSYRCVGSREQIRGLAVDPAAVDALTDYHRPYIDRIELKCGDCGGTMNRAPEVMDCWLDAGAMPYAQWHYPHENRETFAASFPADYICEAVDQTRGWFYTLHAEAVLLTSVGAVGGDLPADSRDLCYRNVICLGHILDDKGRKMSKSLGNVVEPMSVIDHHGSDALRWYLYTATRPGEPRRFSDQLVSESLRRFLLTLWNTYSFFVTYANLDSFDPTTARQGDLTELDRWVLSELNALVRKVTANLEEYDPTTSGRAIQDFVDDLSNWYVRRSRRRFWVGEMDADKLAAYHTLYTCLVTVAKLLAPFTPFVSEAIYQNLVRSVDAAAPESVHLATWPGFDESLIEHELNEAMESVIRVVSLGRAARSKAGIKVRQPLSRIVFWYPGIDAGTGQLRSSAESWFRRFGDHVREELNVKSTEVARSDTELNDLASASDDRGRMTVGLDTRITPDLADEGLAREMVHRIQNLRKSAGFDISDRIVVYYAGWDRLRDLFVRHGDYVREETLADDLLESTPPAEAASEQQKIDGHEVTLAVKRVG